MKLITLLMIAALFASTACSSKKKQAAVEEQSTDQIATFGDDADFIIESDSEDLMAVDDTTLTESIDPIVEEQFIAPLDEVAVASTTGQMGTYTVESGDTYMLIAFKLYGDYRKWKTVADMNPGTSSSQLKPGQSINYDMPSQPFVWNPVGNPYLIRSGDTLGTISNDKYGTAGRWKDIYNNNKPMILDQNQIFAGFTLYWVPDRDIASE